MNTEIGLQILRNQMTMMNALTYCIRGQPEEMLTQQLMLGMSQEFYKTVDLLNQRSLHETEMRDLVRKGFAHDN